MEIRTITSHQLESGARRDFPVPGNPSYGGQLPYEIRGEPGHQARATNSGHTVFDNSFSLLGFNQGKSGTNNYCTVSWFLMMYVPPFGKDIRSTSV